jgi:hypothetical protein
MIHVPTLKKITTTYKKKKGYNKRLMKLRFQPIKCGRQKKQPRSTLPNMPNLQIVL